MPPPPLLPDRYRVLDRIGQGGMATVWRAKDHTSQTEVAIKVLLPHLLENEMVVERFKREIAAVRRIDHPGVVQIFDLIEGDGLLALVLEYHGGLDLKRIIRRHGALPAERVIALGSQLLDALGAAHEHGVIHRDVKPHNVLIGDDHRAKLTDFGLARVDDLVRVTAHTIAFGSPEYVAPEVLGSELIDPRADLYSLGITLFEAATATLPFRADSPLGLVKLHESGERPRLGAFDLPDALARTIERALSRDPDDRFPTAEAMKRALAGERDPSTALTKHGASCAKCGAAMVARVPHCVECDHRPTRIDGRTRAGRRVFVDPPRRFDRNRDVLTFEQKARLMRTLREMGGADNLDERELDQRLKRLPVVVADRLSDQDTSKLARSLRSEGFEISIGWRGFAGWIEAAWQLRTSLLQLLFMYLFIAGPTFVFLAAAMFGAAVEELVGAAYVLGFFGMGAIWMLVNVGRTAPLVTFLGRSGLEKSGDPLSLRAVQLFGLIRSSRLRNLLRRVLNRGFTLDSPRARELVAHALEEAVQIAELEASIGTIDAHAITDRVQTLDERIAISTDTYHTAELIDEKHQLIADLGMRDDKQEEAAQHYARLLRIASDLAVER